MSGIPSQPILPFNAIVAIGAIVAIFVLFTAFMMGQTKGKIGAWKAEKQECQRHELKTFVIVPLLGGRSPVEQHRVCVEWIVRR